MEYVHHYNAWIRSGKKRGPRKRPVIFYAAHWLLRPSGELPSEPGQRGYHSELPAPTSVGKGDRRAATVEEAGEEAAIPAAAERPAAEATTAPTKAAPAVIASRYGNGCGRDAVTAEGALSKGTRGK